MAVIGSDWQKIPPNTANPSTVVRLRFDTCSTILRECFGNCSTALRQVFDIPSAKTRRVAEDYPTHTRISP